MYIDIRMYVHVYICLFSQKQNKNVFNLKHFSKVHAFPHEPFFPKHHVFSKRVMPSFFKNGFQGQVCLYIYVHAYINVNVPKYMYAHDTNAFFRSSPFFFFKEMPSFLQKYPCFFKNTSKVLSCFSTTKKKKTRCFVVQKNMSLCNDVCKFLGFYCFSWSIPHIKLTEFNYPLHQSSSCFKLVLVLLKWVICQDVNDMSLEVRSELPCCCYQ